MEQHELDHVEQPLHTAIACLNNTGSLISPNLVVVTSHNLMATAITKSTGFLARNIYLYRI